MTDEQKNTPSGTEQREENVDLYALFLNTLPIGRGL